MGKVTLNTVEKILTDPMSSSMYELEFDKSKVFPELSKGTEILRVLCQSCVLPAKTIEDLPVDIHAHQLHFAGKVTFSGTMSITFVERQDMVVYETLYAWQKKAKDHQTQAGSERINYATTCKLKTFKQSTSVKNEEIARVFEIKQVWCKEVPEITWNNANELTVIPAVFSFDYFDMLSSTGSTA